jgi:hypothetical protein
MVLSLTFGTRSTLRGMLIQKSLHRSRRSASDSIKLLNLGLQAAIRRNEMMSRLMVGVCLVVVFCNLVISPAFAQYTTVEGVGWEGQGADVAIANLDGDSRPDMVLMAYDNPAQANTFRYKIGWNLNSNGVASRWDNSYVTVEGVGWEGQGAGVAIANLDGNSLPDMVLMAYDNPAQANTFR